MISYKMWVIVSQPRPRALFLDLSRLSVVECGKHRMKDRSPSPPAIVICILNCLDQVEIQITPLHIDSISLIWLQFLH